MTRSPFERALLVLAVLVVSALFVWSLIRPLDYPTWALEVFPVIAAAAILWATRKRFPLTTLSYALIATFSAILLVGARYTYAEVPWGFAVRDFLGWERNPYDRLGHFMQGFTPAIIAREVLLRTSPLRRGGWLNFLVLCVCLAVSAAYELLEWLAAVVTADGAVAFLGTQGDVWDAQWDMFLALVGASAALLLLSRAHDRGLERLRVGKD